MHAFLAFLPILFILVMMGGFKQPAKRVMPIALALTAVLAATHWQMPLAFVFAYLLKGSIESLEIIFIILGALLLLNSVKLSGGLARINQYLMGVSQDKRIQLLIIGYVFVSFLEGAAGFGAPAALAAPILVFLGFPALLAVSATLIADSTAVVFGAVGTPVSATVKTLMPVLQKSDAAPLVHDLSVNAGLLSLYTGLCVPLFMMAFAIFVFGDGNKKAKWSAFCEILPFTLYVGLAFLLPMWLLSYLSYELSSLISAIFSLLLVIFSTKMGFLVPKNTWDFLPKAKWQADWHIAEDTTHVGVVEKPMSLWNALWPYILIALLLVLSRIPALGLKPFLKEKLVISFDWLFHALVFTDQISAEVTWGYNPGVMPFMLITLMIIMIHGLSRAEVKQVLKTTGKQMNKALLPLISGIAMVNLMLSTANPLEHLPSMINVLAKTAAAFSGEHFYWMAAPIGALGTFLSGSATVSNILFVNLHFQVAQELHQSPIAYLVQQSVAGAAGHIISIANIVAVCATVGYFGKEGKIFTINLSALLLYLVLIMLGGLLLPLPL
jgi:lactate permease